MSPGYSMAFLPLLQALGSVVSERKSGGQLALKTWRLEGFSVDVFGDKVRCKPVWILKPEICRSCGPRWFGFLLSLG